MVRAADMPGCEQQPAAHDNHDQRADKNAKHADTAATAIVRHGVSSLNASGKISRDDTIGSVKFRQRWDYLPQTNLGRAKIFGSLSLQGCVKLLMMSPLVRSNVTSRHVDPSGSG